MDIAHTILLSFMAFNMENCSLIDWQTNGEIFVATTTSIFKDIGGETGNEFIT